MRWWLAVSVVLVVAGCSDEPSAVFDERATGSCIGTPAEVPDGGWLGDDGALPPLEGQGIRGTDGLAAVLDALPRGFEVSRAEELATSTSCTVQRVVEATADDGSLFIEQRQLEDTGTLFNVPLSGRQEQEQMGEHGVLVTDDFDGGGNRLTALVVTDTGGWTLVVARGVNGPNLSGWPTTMAPPREPVGEPGPAPLTLEEVVDLAREISESTSTRPSR